MPVPGLPPAPAPEPSVAAGPPAGPPPAGLFAHLRARLAAARHRDRVIAEPGAALGPGVVWEVSRGARVRLGAGCAVGAGTRLHVTGGEVVIGPGAVLGERCVMRIQAGAVVGAGTRLADEVALIDTAPRYADTMSPIREQGVTAREIRIGERARIGARTVLEGGAHVGAGAQVGAGLTVAGEVPAGAVWPEATPPA